MAVQWETVQLAKEENSGGQVNYYLTKVDHPRRQGQAPYQAECEDLIASLGMTFDEGCIFKELWRTANARKGAKKKGQDNVRAGEKLVHYSKQVLALARREAEQALHDEFEHDLEGAALPATGPLRRTVHD